MLWGKKRQQIERLKCRVQELENIICPAKSHKWVCIGCDDVDFGVSIYEYMCVKCNRIEYDYLEPIVKTRRENDKY